MFMKDKSIFSSERILHKDSIEKILVVSLKGVDASTNWLAVNRKS
jgi:hypothetical protein